MGLSAATIVLVLAAAAGGACRSNGERADSPAVPSAPAPAASPQAAPVSREVVLAPGESSRVDGLTLKFDGVSADSRCPVGVQCFWEGDAVVTVSVSEPSRAASNLELHTSGRYPREGTYGRYRVRLVSLVPQPREDGGVPAGEYRATLLVSAP
jgi:hypothetical protein